MRYVVVRTALSLCSQAWTRFRVWLVEEGLRFVLSTVLLLVLFLACRGGVGLWRDLSGIQESQDLVQAAYLKDAAKVRDLLESGVDPNRPDRHGYAALDVADVQGATEVVGVLVEHGARRGLSWWIWEHGAIYGRPLE